LNIVSCSPFENIDIKPIYLIWIIDHYLLPRIGRTKVCLCMKIDIESFMKRKSSWH